MVYSSSQVLALDFITAWGRIAHGYYRTPRTILSRYSRYGTSGLHTRLPKSKSTRAPLVSFWVSTAFYMSSYYHQYFVLQCATLTVPQLVQAGASPREYEYEPYFSRGEGKRETPYRYFHRQCRATCQPIRRRSMHHSRDLNHHTRTTHCTTLLDNGHSAHHAPQGRTHRMRPIPHTGQSYDKSSVSRDGRNKGTQLTAPTRRTG